MAVPQIVEQIAELIATYTGLSVRPQDSKILERIVTQRVRSLQLPSPEAYYSLLQKAPPSTPLPVAESQREWTVLTQSITTIESYFFRDRGQFSLLRDRLLPRAIEQRRLAQQRQGSPRPSLRLWSAGCSTGEEPLSLAILLRELLPDWQEWALLILGTDINAEAIARAQAGLYPEWSFRLTPPALRDRYFQLAGDRWRIDPEVHQMVTFETGNLLGDRFPNLFSHLHDMDIILCRNVFIYFHAAAIAAILQKFHQTLRSDGCLMCAHTELSGQTLQSFQIEPFPESLVYRRACTA
ncbi:MAG: protein-glutamate O-methyltransferase CheR [Coleofasciculaceae cyanobacterium SM2_3_26]|nr:protein-glutamate O-methyltransferase CheR [Coleofasciculaceae cyanobacterium SM2_3_26]